MDLLTGRSPGAPRAHNPQRDLERAGVPQSWAWFVRKERENLSTAAAVGVNHRYSAWRGPSMWLPRYSAMNLFLLHVAIPAQAGISATGDEPEVEVSENFTLA